MSLYDAYKLCDTLFVVGMKVCGNILGEEARK